MQVSQQNLVCNLEILPASLPAQGSEPAAGCSLLLLVALQTEDQQPLPWEDLCQGLTLSLALPAAGGDAAEAAAAGGGRGKGSKAAGRAAAAARKAEAPLILTPECMFEGAQQQLEGLGQEAAGAAAEAAVQGCVVCFRTPELTAAGMYTLTADYRELRPQLLPGLSKEVCAMAPVAAHPVH